MNATARLKLQPVKVDKRTSEYKDAARYEAWGRYLDELWEKGGAKKKTRDNLALGELIVQLQREKTDYLIGLAAAYEKRERPLRHRAAVDPRDLARLGGEAAVRLEAIGCIIAIVVAWSHLAATRDAVPDLLRKLTNPEGLRLVGDDDQEGPGSAGPEASA